MDVINSIVAPLLGGRKLTKNFHYLKAVNARNNFLCRRRDVYIKANVQFRRVVLSTHRLEIPTSNFRQPRKGKSSLLTNSIMNIEKVQSPWLKAQPPFPSHRALTLAMYDAHQMTAALILNSKSPMMRKLSTQRQVFAIRS